MNALSFMSVLSFWSEVTLMLLAGALGWLWHSLYSANLSSVQRTSSTGSWPVLGLLGISLTGVLLHLGYFMGFSFFTLSLGWFLVASLAFIFAMLQLGAYEGSHWDRRHFFSWWSAVQRWWQETKLPVAQWPLLWMGSLAMVSAGIALGWSALVGPIGWDTLTLYDFRAQRLAGGWTVLEFFRQFPGDTDFFLYDMVHPFFSSVLFGLTYQLGGTHVNLWNGAVLLCVWAYGWLVWKQPSTKVLWSLLWWSTPLFLETSVLGYASVYSVSFWTAALLLLWQARGRLRRDQEWILGFWVAAAALSRVSEPYWAVFLVWYSWLVSVQEGELRVRLQRLTRVGLFLVVSVGQWYSVRAQGLQFGSSPDVTRSLDALGSAWPQLWQHASFAALGDVILSFVLSPVAPLALLAGLAWWVWWPQIEGNDRETGVWLGSLAVLWIAMLCMGMLVLRLWLPPAWEEVSKAVSRSVLPLVALGAVLVTAASERAAAAPSATKAFKTHLTVGKEQA